VLGVEGVRAQIGLLDKGLDVAVAGGPDAEPTRARLERIVHTQAAAFALTTGVPELAPVRDVLLSPENPWQLHQLAVLISADGSTYDPAFLVRALDEIDARGPRIAAMAPADRPPYPSSTVVRPLYADVDLLSPEVVVLRALSQNREASWAVVHDGTGVRRERVDRLVHMGEGKLAPMASGTYLGPLLVSDQVAVPNRMKTLGAHAETYAAGVLDNAIRLHAGDDHPAATAVYVEAVRSTSRGGASVPVLRVMATNLVGFLPDLGSGAWMQVSGDVAKDGRKAARIRNPTRPELIRFFSELGSDPDAAMRAGAGMRIWATQVGMHYDPAHPHHEDWQQQVQEVSLIAGVVKRGLAKTGDRNVAAASEFGDGAESLSTLGLTAVLEGVTGGGGGVPAAAAVDYWVAGKAAGWIGDRVRVDAVADAKRRSPDAWPTYLDTAKDLKREVDRRYPENKDDRPNPIGPWGEAQFGAVKDMEDSVHWNGHDEATDPEGAMR
jgi:hypothetical protein